MLRPFLTTVVSILGSFTAMAGEPAVPAPPPPAAKTVPTLQMLAPGFTVRELPVKLTNLTNIEYSPDGRLFASGYDGRLHVLRDTDGDGLEDAATTFSAKTHDDYSLGIVARKEGLYVLHRRNVALHKDTDNDGVPDAVETAVTGWHHEALDKDPLYLKRRVDYALGLAIAEDGTYFIGVGAPSYTNAYLLDKEKTKSSYDRKVRRGVVLKISPDGKKIETVATGMRYLVSMQIDRHGELFATDQEGATWLPNGNPFDELLHVQTGRHYGFPPRHSKWLNDVVDEPSVVDFEPQHQSTCGFRFNGPAPGRGVFGPPEWAGDAIVTAMTRGKLYRVKLVKTPSGYVGESHLIACTENLAVDCAISPTGDLVVAAHTGKPDWGSGPTGPGRLFKISYSPVPQPVLAYPVSATETRVVFDKAVDPAAWKDLAKRAAMEGGRFVAAGDRFETVRPGYAVVKAQMKEAKTALPISSSAADASGKALSVFTPPRAQGLHYALTLPDPASAAEVKGMLERTPQTDIEFILSGVEAAWAGEGKPIRAWLPHPDLNVARALTAASAEHAAIWSAVSKKGTLVLMGQLNLWQMLRPAVQPGSKIDYELPSEKVTVVFKATGELSLKTSGAETAESKMQDEVRLTVTPTEGVWVPFELTLKKGEGEPTLDVSWFTAEDERRRAMPLRRVLLPWVVPPGKEVTTEREIPEITGGSWDAGKALFNGEKLRCAACHTIHGAGGKIGPELTNLSHRDYASVLKDIMQPSAAINPDHVAYLFKLKNGTVATGVISGSTENDVSISDSSGKTVTLARAEIDSTKPSTISLMPEELLEGLSKEQVRDLMTFLLKPASK